MRFVINIENGVFEAKDIDDAFARLGEYFTALANVGICAPTFFEPPLHVQIHRQREDADGA